MVSYNSAISVCKEYKELIKKMENGDIRDNLNPKYLDFMKSVKFDDNLIVQIVYLE